MVNNLFETVRFATAEKCHLHDFPFVTYVFVSISTLSMLERTLEVMLINFYTCMSLAFT